MPIDFSDMLDEAGEEVLYPRDIGHILNLASGETALHSLR
jgi:hypothetical protein